MSWIQYDKPLEILNAEDMTNIANDETEIYNLLIANGFTPTNNLYNVTATAEYPIAKMLELFKNNEYNLGVISNAGLFTPYWKYHSIVETIAPNKWGIWRWIRILNDLHDMLTRTKGKWQRLKCNDGYPTITTGYPVAETHHIQVRGDKL